MIGRAILAAALLPIGAFAQLQLFQFNGTVETAVGPFYDAGSAASGDTVDIRFRIKNVGPGPATVLTVAVDGPGFKVSSPPPPSYILASQLEVEFHVSFSPTGSGPYSASLALNTIVVTTLRGTGIPAALLSFGSTQLTAGATADFGQIEIGASVAKTFTLTNPNSTPVSIAVVSVTGAGFQGPNGISAPLQIAAGKSLDFKITFAPQVGGQARGTLTVDQRTFNLTGLGLVPALPKGTIVVSSATAGSAQQAKVSIALASASKVTGTGTLTMQFLPVAGLPDDAAIQFLSGAKRVATVTIAVGDSIAKFATQPDFAFQTGTTAGSIVFALTLPNSSDQYTLPIMPAVVGIDTATGERRVNDLDVNLAGFDNTHSISQLGFTFYDTKGSVVQPGLIRVVSPPEFKQYFTANQAGGAFTMRASFPVTGDATQISGVDVQVTNSAGTATTQRVRFP
jgi:Abnormal spindle-like microcephaly-assoc'd, ASPM-SPD-2-Hydin